MEKVMKKEDGFTLVEMLLVMLVITVLLLIMIPNVTKNTGIISDKGCDALVNVVTSIRKLNKLPFITIKDIQKDIKKETVATNDHLNRFKFHLAIAIQLNKKPIYALIIPFLKMERLGFSSLLSFFGFLSRGCRIFDYNLTR